MSNATESAVRVEPASKAQGNKTFYWIGVLLLVYLLIAAVGMIGTGFKSATGERAEELFAFANNQSQKRIRDRKSVV